ncbi:hypothetical protein OIU85_017922 [Salix viminalis]|uniref:Uncharacterized protein n=1 Tax=Salix viminalis TaxID=40686 RepID=A0A9Q0ZIE7_SALVM|nr:hypothetical protein OIU85_017922 [Salix viminalis]
MSINDKTLEPIIKNCNIYPRKLKSSYRALIHCLLVFKIKESELVLFIFFRLFRLFQSTAHAAGFFSFFSSLSGEREGEKIEGEGDCAHLHKKNRSFSRRLVTLNDIQSIMIGVEDQR